MQGSQQRGVQGDEWKKTSKGEMEKGAMGDEQEPALEHS